MFESGQNWKIAALRTYECVHYFFYCGGIMDEKYMLEALKEAEKSYKKGDVPVGAIIVCNNKIIARAHNLKEKNKNAIEHAEILVINIACKKLKRWRLNDCELYVTMEPCMMCTGAIIQSRIKKVYYAIKNYDFGTLSNVANNKKYDISVVEGAMANESLKLLQDFFKQKRNTE